MSRGAPSIVRPNVCERRTLGRPASSTTFSSLSWAGPYAMTGITWYLLTPMPLG